MTLTTVSYLTNFFLVKLGRYEGTPILVAEDVLDGRDQASATAPQRAPAALRKVFCFHSTSTELYRRQNQFQTTVV